MRKPFIAANWKMNMLVEDATRYGEDLVEYIKREKTDLKKIDVAVCVPYIHLSSLKVLFFSEDIMVGAQNMHYEESGAYTGEISPAMLNDIGVECVIIGHSERRQYFGETSAVCAKKIKSAVKHGIRPVLCVGETLEERESGRYEDVVKEMVRESLENVTAEEMLKTVIAYEPLWAIGTGKTATAVQANEMAAFIRGCVEALYGPELAKDVIIQYGGSVKPENISELMSMSDIDGALVGGASLDPKKFIQIINYK